MLSSQRADNTQSSQDSEDLGMQIFIAAWIRQAVDEMNVSAKSGTISLAPLKRFQRKIESLTNAELSSQNRFVIFLLSSLIQDLFYNFSGDVPYSKRAEEEKQRMFAGLVDDLNRFAFALESGDSQAKLLASTELVNTYLSGVEVVDMVLTKEED